MTSHLLERHLFLDIETTGLDAGADEVIELGAVLVERGVIVREEAWLVRPGRPLPAVITALTGLTDEALSGAPSFDELVPTLEPLFRDVTVVAHNALFERSFLKGLLDEVPVLDSCELALVLFPELQSHSLDALVRWAGVARGARHRALGDAHDTFLVVKALLERACEPQRRLQLQSLASRVQSQAPLQKLLLGLADASFHASPRPLAPAPPEAVTLPAPLADWARAPVTTAVELEVPSLERLATEVARQAGPSVWLVCPHARLKHLAVPRLPSRSARTSQHRLGALLSRRVVLDPSLAASMAYLESWGARAADDGGSLSGFWRDRVPLFDSMRTLLKSRRDEAPPPGLYAGTHQEVAEWLEAGVRPGALIWLDAPSAVELERRRLTVALELTRLFRLPELAEVAAPGRPVTAALQAVHARTRELAQRLASFTEQTKIERTAHEPWLTLRDAVTALGRDLAWWLSELRAAPGSSLVEGVLAEAAAIAELLPRLTAPDDRWELLASSSGLWLKPQTAVCEASVQALAHAAPSLLISDVRRPAGWERRLGHLGVVRHGRAEPPRPLTIVAEQAQDAALARVALSRPGPLLVLSGETLTEPLVAAFVREASRQGRQVRLHEGSAQPSDVVLMEWWGVGRPPTTERPVVFLNPGDPLGLRRLLASGAALDAVVLRHALAPQAWQAALDGLPWLSASPTMMTVQQPVTVAA